MELLGYPPRLKFVIRDGHVMVEWPENKTVPY